MTGAKNLAAHHDGQNTKQPKTLNQLYAEMQGLFGYFCDPFVPPEERAVCTNFIISTTRKLAILERGGI